MNYKPLPSGLIIKDSGIQGQGVFTTRDLNMGCNLGASHYRVGEELIRTPLGGFINHSEEPNCHRTQVRIKPGFDKWTITVIKNIVVGEELTLKYTMYHPTEPPKDNIKTISEESQEELEPITSPMSDE
tara:strand:+ start:42 stop:428 length:387 start_codon:yes stop_codon:yes gene_type:complete